MFRRAFFVFKGFGKIRNGSMGFPALNAPKTEIGVRKNGGKWGANGDVYSDHGEGAPFERLDQLGRLCLATGLPSWKISRLMKRLELLRLVEVEEELRFTRGRPRRLCRLTSSGIEYFTGLLMGASDEDNAESHAPSTACGKTRGDENEL